MLAEAENRRRDAWDQHNGILDKWGMLQDSVWDAVGILRQIAANPGGATPPTTAAALDLGPLANLLAEIRDDARAYYTDFAGLASTALLQLQELATQTDLLTGILEQTTKLAEKFEVLASGTPNLPAAAGAGSTFNVTVPNPNPTQMAAQLARQYVRTGLGRSGAGLFPNG